MKSQGIIITSRHSWGVLASARRIRDSNWKVVSPVQGKYSSVLNTAIEAAGENGQSIVFICYTGHCILEGKVLQFNPTDSQLDFEGKGLVGSWLRLYYPTETPVDVVFIFDCCYSLETRGGLCWLRGGDLCGRGYKFFQAPHGSRLRTWSPASGSHSWISWPRKPLSWKARAGDP